MTIIFFLKPESGHLIFMMGLCKVNFGPYTAQRDVQCNGDSKKTQLGSSFASMCLTKYDRQSTDTLDLPSFPNFGDIAT